MSARLTRRVRSARRSGRARRAPLARSMSLAAVAAVSLAGCAQGSSTTTSSTGPTGSPIQVGYANTEGKGALSFPHFTVGVQAALAHINESGGVKGRPIALESCLGDGSPATSLACANTFVQKKAVLVLDGVDVGVDAMLPVLDGAGTTAIAITFQAPKASADPKLVQLSPPLDASIVLPMSLFAKGGAKTMAFVGTDVPQVHTAFEGSIKPLAAKLGMQASLVTYNSASPDFAAVAATLTANKTDAAFFSGPDEMCNSFVSAAGSSGYSGQVNMGVCSQFFQKFPAQSRGYRAIGFAYPAKAASAAPAPRRAELEQFVADLKKAGHPELVDDATTLWGYVLMRNAAAMLEKVDGEITPQSVSRTLTSLTDFQMFAGDKITCAGRVAAQGAACSDGLLVLEGAEDGTLKVVGEGFTKAG